MHMPIIVGTIIVSVTPSASMRSITAPGSNIGMVTVTRVDMSEDLRYAKVFVSFLTEGEERERSLRLLRKARKFVRGELAHTLRLRVAPELTFDIDESSENYIRISNVLKRVEEEERLAEGPDDADETGESPEDEGGEQREGA